MLDEADAGRFQYLEEVSFLACLLILEVMGRS